MHDLVHAVRGGLVSGLARLSLEKGKESFNVTIWTLALRQTALDASAAHADLAIARQGGDRILVFGWPKGAPSAVNNCYEIHSRTAIQAAT